MNGPPRADARLPPDATRRRRMLSAAALALLMGGGLVFSLSGAGPLPQAEDIEAFAGDLGPWGPVAIAALMIVHCFIPFPAELAALAAGALFGWAWGAVYVWTGAMAGAALSFGLARWLGRGVAVWALGAEKAARLDAVVARRGVEGLLIARLIPLIAFNIVNYGAGLTSVGWRRFLWTTAIGILPLTVASTAMGAAMTALDWRASLAIGLGGAVLALGVVWIWRRIRR